MNKRIIIIIMLSIIISSSRNTLAINDLDVRYTVHNFSFAQTQITNASRNYFALSSNETTNQVCIFCHTPHNASPAVPLWNKGYNPATAGTYKLYTSSPTLSSVAKGATIGATSVSMLCLSCHDGKTAINVLHNARAWTSTTSGGEAIIDLGIGLDPNATQSLGQAYFSAGTYPSNLGAVRDSTGAIPDANAAINGTNLTDDHPIGFSYSAVQAQKPNDFLSLPTAKTNGLRFFGPNNNVECSSCHNPHVYYGYGRSGSASVLLPVADPLDPRLEKKPFLVKSNKGSALCLGCHNK